MSTESKLEVDLVGKVTLGLLEGVRAVIPVTKSLFSFIKGIVTREPEPQFFTVPWARTQVWVTQDDEGTLSVFLSLLNMYSHEATVNHLLLERIMASGNDLALMAPMFTPPTSSVASCNIQKVYFHVPLTGPAIRLLHRVVQKAQNLLSTPRVELTVIGSLDIISKGKRVRVPFTVASQPELNLLNQIGSNP